MDKRHLVVLIFTAVKISTTINDLEHRLKEYELSDSHSYIDNIDIESFARFFYHTNVLMNMDPNR